MSSAITSGHFTAWDEISPVRCGLKCINLRKKKAWEESASQWKTELLLLCNKHTRLSSRTLSSSILYVLHHWVIRAQGWWMGPERSSFYASSQACVSQTRSPAAINLVLRPLKPASNNATALQTKEEIRSRSGRRSRTGNQREKRKTSCSRWHQMYLRGSSRGSAERALPRYERLQTGSERQGGESLQGEDELMHRGGRREPPLPPLDSTWFMWQLPKH